jgi:arsenite-transporting ATPase
MFFTREPTDAVARAFEERGKRAIVRMPEALRSLPCVRVPLLPYSLVVGTESLKSMFTVETRELPTHDLEPDCIVDSVPLATLIDEIERLGPGVVLTMGKVVSAKRPSPRQSR